MTDLKKFRELGLSETAIDALREKGYTEPTPIQAKTIPLLLSERQDIIGQAKTGTGKTAGFGLPIIEKIKPGQRVVQAIILTPTRELAIQVAEEIASLTGTKPIRVAPFYGGQSIQLQFKLLKRGVDIVVGTPGRILDHLQRKTLKIDQVRFVVLDEADEMLNMGFQEDVERILNYTPDEKRMLLFSATMPKPILSIARRYMKDYIVVSVKEKHMTVDATEQIYMEVFPQDRFEALCRIIDFEEDFYGLVFCRTKLDVDSVANKLLDRGYQADALHGDISQSQREKILNKFKKRHSNVLVATDVAARGIDIQDLTHVINYSLPQDAESYVHRIGRTGRAGKEGTAISLITPDEYRRLRSIKRVTRSEIRKRALPKIKDLIENKISRLKKDLESAIEKENYNDYLPIARSLLSEYDAETAFAALLKVAFQDELDAENYRKIGAVSVRRNGKTRLFVARGKEDGMTLFKLLDFIKHETRIHSEKIQDVQIFDKFSFITVPEGDAETILQIFKKRKRGSKPLVVKARAGRNMT